jgi:hypothetical protein
MGQSNIAAGATIGSNHNSRSADGELMAGRGFWPGLCVSLKHNSKFASFSILAKGDYPAELNIPIPFCLINNDVTNNRLVIMPGYWFMYNMYALERNGWKYADRDKRTEKIQHLEYDYLAPDSINEILEAIQLFETLTGEAWVAKFESSADHTQEEITAKGKQLLTTKDPIIDELEILADGFENTKRKVIIIKICPAYQLFGELIKYYTVNQLLKQTKNTEFDESVFLKTLPEAEKINQWMNVGGQLIPRIEVDGLRKDIQEGKIDSWDEMHAFYKQQEEAYDSQKLQHALSAYFQVTGKDVKHLHNNEFINLLQDAITTKEWMTEGIYKSREKDYSNPFREMPYQTREEMDAVVGKLEDNSFIKQQREELEHYKKEVQKCIKKVQPVYLNSY